MTIWQKTDPASSERRRLFVEFVQMFGHSPYIDQNELTKMAVDVFGYDQRLVKSQEPK